MCFRQFQFSVFARKGGLSRVILFLAAVFSIAPGRGVQWDHNLSQLMHEKWQTEQGLPQNAVHCLAQDVDGFIWFGTENGLVRFDGVRFEIFSETSEPAAPHNYVSSLLAAKDGTLWAGTRTGGFWRYREGKFEVPYPALEKSEVCALAETSDGRVWVGTKEGLYCLEKSGRLQRFGKEEGLATEHVTALHASGEEVWIGTREGEILRLKGGILRVVVEHGWLVSGASVKGLAHDRATDELWIACDGAGLFVLRTNEIIAIDLFKDGAAEYLQAMHRDEDGSLWLATQDRGLARYFGGNVSEFKAEDGLADNDVLSVLRDREGSIWVGTHFGGLNRLHEGKAVTFTKREGLPADTVTCVVEGEGETLWLGTLGGGVVKYENCIFTPLPVGAPLSTPRTDVRALLRANNGDLWIGTHGGGLGRYQTNGALQFFTTQDGLVEDSISVLFQRRNGEVWIGTVRSGINVYDGSGFRTLDVPDFMRTHLRAIAEDSRGGLWIGTQNGLVFYSHGRFEQVRVPGALDLSVRSLACEADDTLWIGSRDHGLFRMKEGGVTRFSTVEGLAHTRIYQVLVSGENLWLAGNQGIERVARVDLEAVAAGHQQRLNTQLLTKKEGLRTSECGGDSSPSAVVARDGVLWFGTRGGLAQVDPALTEQEGKPPKVLVRSLAVDNERVAPRDFKGLEPGATRLQINYTALSLRNPANVFFKYKLEGVDADWVDAGRSREAVYYNLRPGDYAFRVTACNDEGIWNQAGALLAFTVAPAFYQTIWFRAGAILAGLSGVFGAYRWRVESIRRRNGELKTLVEDRTQKLRSEVEQRADAEQKLLILNEDLDLRVKARTGEVRNAYENLQIELHERQEAEQALGDYCGGALERIHAEAARTETERRFSTFMRNAPALAWMKDSQFRYVFTNEMFQRFTGWAAEEIEGKSDYDLWPDHVAFHMRTNDTRAVETQSKLETQEQLKRHDGEARTLLTLRFLFTTATGEQFVAGMSMDITEQKRAEEALHQLPQSIIEAQEAERRRVARELHDGVNQAIASIKFRIQTAEQQILRADPKWQETCGKTKEMLDSVLQQVRGLSRNLRPGELDDFGLVAAARSACQEFEARTGTVVKFSHSEFAERLPPTLELSFYRIIQEALTNVEKHAGATEVLIDLETDDSYVMLEMSDNGRGFEAKQAAPRGSGLGLLHMRERASLVGGVFSVFASPGNGVRLMIQAPIRRGEEALSD